MSTILKALQRLEGEKGGAGETGGLREGLVPQGEPLVRESARRRWRLGIHACLAALLLGFFVWWMIPAGQLAPTAAPPQPSPAVAVAPEPRPAPPPRSGPRPSVTRDSATATARPGAPVEGTAASSKPGTVAASPPRWLSEARVPGERLAEAPPPPPAEKRAPRERAVKTPPPPSAIEKPVPEKRVAEAPPVPAAPPAPEPAPPPIQPPPRIEKAPAPRPSAPAPVAVLRPPEVKVNRTVWHPTPERRVAEIEVEGRKGVLELHEGDAVGTLVVEEIQPSGVVFLHGGERLLRKVGSGS